MAIISLLTAHQDCALFRDALNRLRQPALPIASFVSALEKKPAWTTAEIRAFFGDSRKPEPQRRIAEIAALIPEYGEFLDQHCFHAHRDNAIDPAEFVHDAIGHIALGNPITPRGEVVACAGVAGFSSKIGMDYFINALLMFCLGYRLFDDVPPARVPVDSAVREDIDVAYRAGSALAQRLEYSEQGQAMAMDFIIQAWPRIRQRKTLSIP